MIDLEAQISVSSCQTLWCTATEMTSHVGKASSERNYIIPFVSWYSAVYSVFLKELWRSFGLDIVLRGHV